MKRLFNSVSQFSKLCRISPRLFAGTMMSSLISYQEDNLSKPETMLDLENIKEKWSYKHLLQQSSLLSMEQCSVTLTQTVVAIQAVASSYCENMTQLAALYRYVDTTRDGNINTSALIAA